MTTDTKTEQRTKIRRMKQRGECWTCGRTNGKATADCSYCGVVLCCTKCGLAPMSYHMKRDCPDWD